MANIQHSALAGDDLHVNKLHASTHQSGGTDVVALDTLGAPTDITTLNASATAHGLCPKLNGSAIHALLGTGSWGQPGAATWDGAHKTVSTLDPSGGSDGDIWFKYMA